MKYGDVDHRWCTIDHGAVRLEVTGCVVFLGSNMGSLLWDVQIEFVVVFYGEKMVGRLDGSDIPGDVACRVKDEILAA